MTMGRIVDRQRPLRRAEYERMIAAGLFRDERIELIRGVIVEMSPQNEPHSDTIQALTELLQLALAGRVGVRVQLPFIAGDDSLPEPDVAIVEHRRFRDAHPDRAFLLIEVADSSLKFDRHEKADLYAQANVPEYWVVNLAERIIERYTEPVSDAYTRVTPFRAGETIAPLAFPDATIPVSDVFGA
jgi:Uma2 family endonuclease